MSCNYADGLSPYENKGVLGTPEKFDASHAVEEKCERLAEWIRNSKHVVVHTGAGISTAAGIPDFRGPNGVWTLEKQGKKPNIDISFDQSVPTKTHMALKKLVETGYVQYIISQNIDGLHLRTGVPRKHIAELHGNMFVEQCNVCDSQFIRSSATQTVGKKLLGMECRRAMLKRRACRGKMQDTILDWEDNLPEDDLEMSEYHSSLADLSICLGTTLQIVPSGNLPLRCKKFGGKVVIVNLQSTKHDKKADLIINTYVDDVLEKVMKKLDLEIPDYSSEIDPTRNLVSDVLVTWNVPEEDIKEMKARYEVKLREYRKKKLEEKQNAEKKIIKKDELKEEDAIVKNDSNELLKETYVSEFCVNSNSGLDIKKDEMKDESDELSADNNDSQIIDLTEDIIDDDCFVIENDTVHSENNLNPNKISEINDMVVEVL